MIRFVGRGILVDIEGTTSSIAFVHEVMFPFVRRELVAYLSSHWGQPGLAAACLAIAKDAGFDSLTEWSSAKLASPADAAAQQALVVTEIQRLMDGDVKATGLKALQGLIWDQGFASGELQADLFEDVPPALVAWNEAARDVRVYSSGSIQAQKLFFGHTTVGNLLKHFRGHYDTTIGGKKEAASYAAIAQQFELPAGKILFLSDLVAELDAARTAGMQTGLSCRPGNPPIADDHGHARLTSFAEVVLV